MTDGDIETARKIETLQSWADGDQTRNNLRIRYKSESKLGAKVTDIAHCSIARESNRVAILTNMDFDGL
ncbi:MAG: hypothetical protein VXY55_00390, partial [Pseudomonadota bacterium]|nr:hypothetical protein [Pseudomonadota bacterium]